MGQRGRRAENQVTRMSKSKTRRVAAIGNSRVIPAEAGIQCLWPMLRLFDERHWIPAFAGMTGICNKTSAMKKP